MKQPLYDLDLKRVSHRHYITGKAAINFPHRGCITGGWHFLSYSDREAGVAISLAGIHYPNTDAFFGDTGITDVTEQFRKRGWAVEDKKLFMADHYRAAADMILRWALSDSEHCNVEIDEWFPARDDKQGLLRRLDLAKPKLTDAGMLQKIEAWLSSQ
ncbi:hypothetical protein IFR09_11600 [Pseudomonas syringae]|nr:hypothetical protein [Pseudomonas syringae]MBD8801844.1 hypothetical protein [Pseudomonas syringae]MBD8811806.1 hypothetical protein [Pseudomonas syringae]